MFLPGNTKVNNTVEILIDILMEYPISKESRMRIIYPHQWNKGFDSSGQEGYQVRRQIPGEGHSTVATKTL